MTWDYNETIISWCDGNTDWTAVGTSVALESGEDYPGKGNATASPTDEVVEFEGSSASSSGGIQRDVGAGNQIDVTTDLISWWFLYTGKSDEFLQNSDSVKVRLRSGTSGTSTNYYEYILTGAQTAGEFFPVLAKSWNAYGIGGANRGSQVGTPATDLTSIRFIDLWFEWQTANSGDQQPGFAVDFAKYGTKFTVTGGTSSAPETLDGTNGLREFNDGDPANRFTDPDYGLVLGANIFFEMWAGVDVGNDTTATYLAVENIFLFNNLYAEEVQYDWNVTNNATCRLGKLDQQAQQDYPVSGCTFINADEVYISSFFVQNGATFECYATKFFRWKDVEFGEVAAGTDPTIDIRESDFDTIRNVEFRSTNADIADTKFHDPLPTFLNATGAWQDDNGSYTNILTNWNNDTTATAIFPTTEVVDQDGHIFGYSEQFTSVEFEISTAGVAGAVTFQYWNGTAWTDLSNVVDGTNSFTATASEGAYDRYRVTWDLPGDWATRQLSAEGQQYYIRANIDTVYTTNPQIQQGRIGQRRVGILVDAPNSLSNVQFFKCDRALYFQASVTVTGYNATDNAYDLVVDNTLTISLVNSTFNPDKILQV